VLSFLFSTSEEYGFPVRFLPAKPLVFRSVLTRAAMLFFSFLSTCSVSVTVHHAPFSFLGYITEGLPDFPDMLAEPGKAHSPPSPWTPCSCRYRRVCLFPFFFETWLPVHASPLSLFRTPILFVFFLSMPSPRPLSPSLKGLRGLRIFFFVSFSWSLPALLPRCQCLMTRLLAVCLRLLPSANQKSSTPGSLLLAPP